ncbi:MAG TPA: queuosine precursor transporter [Bacteroidota bacterium]|nr:queuosine precursor transporter [Bacteroidota bacterium]
MDPVNQAGSSGRTFRYLEPITGLFVAVLLISNIASSKIVEFGPLTFDGGTLLFPVSYIFGDILTEVYGYKRSRQVIWLGFFCAFLMAATLAVVQRLPAAAGWDNQAAYEKILGMTPRIVAASLLGYWSGEFSNSYVLAKMKIWTEGRWLWTRTIGSTIVGEAVDSLLFLVVAFAGVLPNGLLLTLFVSNYVFKCGVEIVFTPVTYAVVRHLKREEGIDLYDRGTRFNPFILRDPG